MDIAAIVEMAKEGMLKNGSHTPTLIAEGQTGKAAIYFLGYLPETTFEKQKMLFGIGREHGIGHPGNIPTQCYFVSEAWVSIQKEGEERKYRSPSEDPNRKEMLIILHLNTEAGTCNLHRAEILRAGTVVDVLPRDTLSDVTDRLLPCFLAGVLSTKMSDEELAAMIAEYAGGEG